MDKRIIVKITAVLAICFLVSGVMCTKAADRHSGYAASVGAIVNNDYSEISSGKVGANKEKQGSLLLLGSGCYILAGITGVACVVTILKSREK